MPSIVNDNNALSFEFWGCAPINTQVFSLSIDIKLWIKSHSI